MSSSPDDPPAWPQGPLDPQLQAYRWMLQVGASLTGLTLSLLQAQLAALEGPAGDAVAMAPAGARLTVRDVYDRMQAAGYREISEIEWEDEYYEVEARDPHGRRVELQVDGSSGAITRSRPKD